VRLEVAVDDAARVRERDGARRAETSATASRAGGRRRASVTPSTNSMAMNGTPSCSAIS
jgi:hypothetical protein